MTYCVTGLDHRDFASLFALDEKALEARGCRSVIADADRGYPCRVSLREVPKGERLLLLNHTSHAVNGPYRATHAIFVSEKARTCEPYIDDTPPVFQGRALSLRGFDDDGMMVDAVLCEPGEADAGIRALFSETAVAFIHAHNAVRGCFSARIDRHGG